MTEPSTEPREPTLSTEALSELCLEKAHTEPLYAVAAALLAHAEAVSGGLDQVTAALITVGEKITEHGQDTAPIDHSTELDRIADALEGVANAMPGDSGSEIANAISKTGEVTLVDVIAQLGNVLHDALENKE
jgi:hypothetical protein